MTLSLSVWISIVGLWALVLSEGYSNNSHIPCDDLLASERCDAASEEQMDKDVTQYLTQLKKNYEIQKITHNRIELDI